MDDIIPYNGPGCYLLCFSAPYKHARHYLGYSDNIASRIERHNRGEGARLITVILEAGLSFRLVRQWPDTDKSKEKQLKRRKAGSRHCPDCGRKGKKECSCDLYAADAGEI